MAADLDPGIAERLRELSEEGVPPLHTLSLAEAREAYRSLSPPTGRPEVGDVSETTATGPAGQVPLRAYRPRGRDGDRVPAVVYLHGGGWALGGFDTHDVACRALANASGCAVVAVEYRLAPEHPFPAGLEDCYAALRSVERRPGELGVDPDRIAIAGDSAGANLATAVALLARDRDGPAIAHQALAYPAVRRAFDTASYEENASGYFLTREDMRRFWGWYLREDADGRHPYAAPLLADPGGLPPASVLTCGFDPLRDEGQLYADRLEEAGVSVERRHYEGAIHGFMTMLGDPGLDLAREAIEAVGGTLGEVLRG